MLSVDFTFLWTALNLVVLFLFLKKFLFGRVTQFMDERNARIEADMAQGAQDKAEGEAMRVKYQELAQSAVTERAATLEDARKKAAAQFDQTVADAKREAGRIVAEAQTQAEAERTKAMADMRDEVASLALAAASKVMQANMESDKNRKLVDELLDEIMDEGVA